MRLLARRHYDREYFVASEVLRCGVTILELLITLSIVGLLISLLLPALHSSREAARRITCQANLHLLALAAVEHEATHAGFPYTATVHRDRRGVRHPSVSPHRYLLPWLDHGALFNTIDFRDFSPNRPGPPSTGSLVNAEALTTTVGVYRCPSDPGMTAGGNSYRACLGSGPGVFGPEDGRGAFVNGRSVRSGDFTDGLSNTVMFSERVVGDRHPRTWSPWNDVFFHKVSVRTSTDAQTACATLGTPGIHHDSFSGTTWFFGGWNHTWYNHVLPPNASIPDCSAGGTIMSGGGHGAYSARSLHSGGVNLTMADASTRFVGTEIDTFIWRAISTRADQ